jgi:PAS domain S-box-containing protein
MAVGTANVEARINRPDCPEPIAEPELQEPLVREAPSATVVLSPQGTLLSWGRAAQELYGWRSEEAIGRSLDELTVPAFAAETWRAALDEAMHRPIDCRVLQARHKDGRLVLLQVSVRAAGGAEGRPSCLVTSQRDVTAERVREDIAEVGQRYQGLLESMPDAIVVLNEVGAIVLFNGQASQLFGVAAAQALGQPVEILLPPGQREAHVGRPSNYLHRPRHRVMGSGLDVHGLHADGHLFPVEVCLSPLAIGERQFVVGALRDLSERKRYEEALTAAQAAERASAAKTEFLSRMSHELRTPLNAVLGFARLLQMDNRDPLAPRQMEQLQQIERAGRHLLAMINDLLDVSRIEAGTLAMSIEPLRVADVAEEALAMTGALAREAEVTLRPLVGAGELYVRADRVRLRQVLINLLANAVKYNRSGGQVELRITAEGPEVAVAVSDTGRGMTPEQVEQLFQPFNRLGAERTRVEGTGIGLVIARRLTETMGGVLQVSSEPGAGSVFTLRLGACDAPVAPPPNDAPLPEESSAGAAALRLLYVEDNAVNVDVVAAALRLRPAWRMRSAASGAQAIAEARHERPHLLLVDMHLGDMTGLALAAALDRHSATAGIARVALSADAMPRQVREALDAGFDGYLTKPLDVAALLRCLDDHAAPAR